MTNEEIINYGSMMPSARSAAQCACDVKDQQFKEYLEKKKAKLLLMQDDVSNQREFDLIDQRILLIEEIINEHF